MNTIPKFPLGVPNEIVSKFMTMDVYTNKDKYYPTIEGVKYMSGERKQQVYKAMKKVYNNDEIFRNWFLKEIKNYQK